MTRVTAALTGSLGKLLLHHAGKQRTQHEALIQSMSRNFFSISASNLIEYTSGWENSDMEPHLGPT